MHIPQCFLVHSFVFHLVLPRQFVFPRQWRVGFFSFSFCGLAILSPTQFLRRFRVSLRERRRGALELVFAFWCLLGPCALGHSASYPHNDSAARSHRGPGRRGATRLGPRLYSHTVLFWSNLGTSRLIFIHVLEGGFSRGNNWAGKFMDYGTVLQGQRAQILGPCVGASWLNMRGNRRRRKSNHLPLGREKSLAGPEQRFRERCFFFGGGRGGIPFRGFPSPVSLGKLFLLFQTGFLFIVLFPLFFLQPVCLYQ